MTPGSNFAFPLNVFMHVLAREGPPEWLHYGLFEREDEPLAVAQERSTALLWSRLPPPPARILEVGVGLGTALRRMVAEGYDAEGITPSAPEVAFIGERHRGGLRVHEAAFETFAAPAGAYDAIVFHESSPYIDPEVLFARAAALAERVLVVDEFALLPVDAAGGLPTRRAFLAAAERHGFTVEEELDLSLQAAPTIAWFAERIPADRRRLTADLGLADGQIDALLESGSRYAERYANGTYGYRLILFTRSPAQVGSNFPLSTSPLSSAGPSSQVAAVSQSRELEIAHDRERRSRRRLEQVEAQLAKVEQTLAAHVAERAQLVAERDDAVARMQHLERLLAEQQRAAGD